MNRREFIFRTSAAAAALVAAPAIALTPTPPPPPADPFEILSPDEIRAWLGKDRYVSTPCFQLWRVEDGQLDSTPYAVKTQKVTVAVHHSGFPLSDTNRKRIAEAVKRHVRFTHVYSVRFCEIPDWAGYHLAYVRGATVRNLSSIVHGKISLTLSDV
jgi:hypothetical protein